MTVCLKDGPRNIARLYPDRGGFRKAAGGGADVAGRGEALHELRLADAMTRHVGQIDPGNCIVMIPLFPGFGVERIAQIKDRMAGGRAVGRHEALGTQQHRNAVHHRVRSRTVAEAQQAVGDPDGAGVLALARHRNQTFARV